MIKFCIEIFEIVACTRSKDLRECRKRENAKSHVHVVAAEKVSMQLNDIGDKYFVTLRN